MSKLIKQSWVIMNNNGEESEVSFEVEDGKVSMKLFKSIDASELKLDEKETKQLRDIFENTKYIFTNQNLK